MKGRGQCALFRSRHSKCVMERKKRFSYTTKFKLAVVEFAERNSNREAERCYGVSEKCVRDWRKQKTKLEKMPMSKRADRPGGKPFWPELEARLVSWVREKRQEGVGISGSMIHLRQKYLR